MSTKEVLILTPKGKRVAEMPAMHSFANDSDRATFDAFSFISGETIDGFLMEVPEEKQSDVRTSLRRLFEAGLITTEQRFRR